VTRSPAAQRRRVERSEEHLSRQGAEKIRLPQGNYSLCVKREELKNGRDMGSQAVPMYAPPSFSYVMPAEMRKIRCWGRRIKKMKLMDAVECPPIAYRYQPSAHPSYRHMLWVFDAKKGLANFTIGNVHRGGHICWGGVELPHSPLEAWQAFWEAPFNQDLVDIPTRNWTYERFLEETGKAIPKLTRSKWVTSAMIDSFNSTRFGGLAEALNYVQPARHEGDEPTFRGIENMFSLGMITEAERDICLKHERRIYALNKRWQQRGEKVYARIALAEQDLHTHNAATPPEWKDVEKCKEWGAKRAEILKRHDQAQADYREWERRRGDWRYTSTYTILAHIFEVYVNMYDRLLGVGNWRTMHPLTQTQGMGIRIRPRTPDTISRVMASFDGRYWFFNQINDDGRRIPKSTKLGKGWVHPIYKKLRFVARQLARNLRDTDRRPYQNEFQQWFFDKESAYLNQMWEKCAFHNDDWFPPTALVGDDYYAQGAHYILRINEVAQPIDAKWCGLREILRGSFPDATKAYLCPNCACSLTRLDEVRPPLTSAFNHRNLYCGRCGGRYSLGMIGAASINLYLVGWDASNDATVLTLGPRVFVGKKTNDAWTWEEQQCKSDESSSSGAEAQAPTSSPASPESSGPIPAPEVPTSPSVTATELNPAT
jgi:hypothetical protein